MDFVAERRGEIVGGFWLIGLGLLFYTGAWWPGIMFVIAATAVVEGYFRYGLWYGVQAGFWAAVIGAWALAGYSLVFLFMALGGSMLLGARLKPSPFAKPEPFVDASLE
jgi:hypothetical protein